MPYTDLLADYASAYNQTNRLLRLRLASNAGIAPDASMNKITKPKSKACPNTSKKDKTRIIHQDYQCMPSARAPL